MRGDNMSNLNLYGVEFDDAIRYNAIRKSLESSKIEGYKPTKESVQNIKNLMDGTMKIEDLADLFQKRDKERSLLKDD